MGQYSLFANVHFGAGKAKETGVLCRPLGRRACMIADPFFQDSGTLKEIQNALSKQGISSVCFFDFHSDPDCTEVDKCVAFIKQEACDFLIALGGGSCIDTAKAAALTAQNGGECWEYCGQVFPDGSNGVMRRPEKGALPLAALPTTAGSGSEANKGCVISNRALRVKSGIGSDCLFPRVAIVDPCLMTGLPPRQTAYTGFDAFSHAFESYMLNTTTYFSEALALQSIRFLGESFVAAVQNGGDLAVREKMANASTLAGMNIALTDTSVGHVLGQPLSALFHMVHGATLAVTLDSIVEWLLPTATEKLARVAAALCPALGGVSAAQQAARLPELLRELKKKTDIGGRLGDYGVKKSDIPCILDYVEEHVGLSSPVLTEYAKAPTRKDLEDILHASF
ncbi:iron-containing alcohol dehydrogenase family protein [Allofournierella sp.]|uniref:iron-containing alcohol dehydrogenase family protein n=1 Tax=Allofournierella sp. TaxID=1940256 RepID=UPI003AB76F9A